MRFLSAPKLKCGISIARHPCSVFLVTRWEAATKRSNHDAQRAGCRAHVTRSIMRNKACPRRFQTIFAVLVHNNDSSYDHGNFNKLLQGVLFCSNCLRGKYQSLSIRCESLEGHGERTAEAITHCDVTHSNAPKQLLQKTTPCSSRLDVESIYLSEPE